MKFIHYTSEPIEQLCPCSYLQDAKKPRGLWFSAETDDPDDTNWKDSCILEEYNLEILKYRYEVHLTRDANILRIRTHPSMVAFTQEYTHSPFGVMKIMNFIDWQAVSERFQGIIIAPYQYQCRLHPDFFWYYGWDCASGCIWDLNAIEQIQNIGGENQ